MAGQTGRIAAVVLACLLVFTGTTSSAADHRNKHQGGRAEQAARLTPEQAAAQAKARYGGKVLKVSRFGKGYKVRLLQESGRVITVTIGA